jgi:hypothetical protein
MFFRILIVCSLLFCNIGYCFEIYALGTSGTNCKGVARDQIFTVKLEEMLKAKGINADVINGGIDGDNPLWMIKRLDPALEKYKSVKLVIFEPGPNQPTGATNEYSKLILEKLQKMNMPTIYISPPPYIQPPELVAELEKKYGFYYYGNWKDNIPWNNEYRQANDLSSKSGGHLTALGCLKIAELMLPLVVRVIEEKQIN